MVVIWLCWSRSWWWWWWWWRWWWWWWWWWLRWRRQQWSYHDHDEDSDENGETVMLTLCTTTSGVSSQNHCGLYRFRSCAFGCSQQLFMTYLKKGRFSKSWVLKKHNKWKTKQPTGFFPIVALQKPATLSDLVLVDNNSFGLVGDRRMGNPPVRAVGAGHVARLWYKLGGGSSNMFYFHPNWGKMNPIWRAYFSDGLVQPPTSKLCNLWFSRLKLAVLVGLLNRCVLWSWLPGMFPDRVINAKKKGGYIQNDCLLRVGWPSPI